jgi:hypothetical protein
VSPDVEELRIYSVTWGEMRNAYKMLVRKPQGNDHLGDLVADGF